MRGFYLKGLVLLACFDTAAQLCLKYAADRALPLEWNPAWLLRLAIHPWVYGAVAGYLCAFGVWMTLLRHAPIGPAFAASHVELVTVLIVSAILFGEPITIQKSAGALLILAGIVCLGWSETRPTPTG